MPRPNRIPSYRLHRPSGRAVVTLNGKDIYLGAFNTPESNAEYQRVIGEWLAQPLAAAGGVRDGGPSVAEIMVAYLEHAKNYYRDADGNCTSGYDAVRYSLLSLEAVYARTPAAEFGPLSLKAVRQKMIENGITRRVINDRIGQIKRMFKWASSEELIPPSVFHGLSCVEGLRKGDLPRRRLRRSDRSPTLT